MECERQNNLVQSLNWCLVCSGYMPYEMRAPQIDFYPGDSRLK